MHRSQALSTINRLASAGRELKHDAEKRERLSSDIMLQLFNPGHPNRVTHYALNRIAASILWEEDCLREQMSETISASERMFSGRGP